MVWRPHIILFNLRTLYCLAILRSMRQISALLSSYQHYPDFNNSQNMAAIESIASGLRANYWTRRPSQRANFSLGRKFSASEAYFQNNTFTPIHDFNIPLPYYNWNFYNRPMKMNQHSKFQNPHVKISPPRSFEDLHRERTYLLSSLQQEDHKATELLKRLPPLEVLMQNPTSRSGHRKAKRQLGWLRHRLGETTKQEKSILARLGQLSWEIQSRERLVQIDCERREMERSMGVRQSSWLAPTSGFDARGTEFQPLGNYTWPPQQNYYSGDYFDSQQPRSLISDLATTNPQQGFASMNQVPFELPASVQPVEKIEHEEELVANNSNRSNSLTVAMPFGSATRQKRMSLPTLSSEWPNETNKIEEQEKHYVGYYIEGA